MVGLMELRGLAAPMLVEGSGLVDERKGREYVRRAVRWIEDMEVWREWERGQKKVAFEPRPRGRG